MYPEYDENTMLLENKESDREFFTRETMKELMQRPKVTEVEVEMSE